MTEESQKAPYFRKANYINDVDDWLSNPSSLKSQSLMRLKLWVRSEDLEWRFREHLDHKHEKKYLQHEKVWDRAQEWMKSAKGQLIALRITTRKKPLDEFLWRIVRERMQEAIQSVKKVQNLMAFSASNSPDAGAVRFLPADIKWSYLHPGLMVTDEALDDSVTQSTIQAYLDANPAPNTGAVSMFQWARKNMDKFIPNVQKLMAEGRKAEKAAEALAKKANLVSEEDSEEDISISDLLSTLGRG